MATEMKRISICVSEQTDNEIIELKKTDAYCRCSYAEIVRKLLELGLRATRAQEQTA